MTTAAETEFDEDWMRQALIAAGEAEIRDVAHPELVASRDVHRPHPIRMLQQHLAGDVRRT